MSRHKLIVIVKTNILKKVVDHKPIKLKVET